ncbi:mannitol-1-phosphate 5-dehydrogenase [Enterococcus sp. 669A]|uniref:Mannitol-1-phosphate 5-dehydrogenase n=1 Tax=Candidatus Enterococcus moelleringii TaxID=2815325 RepID=A0ABS3LG99_9ENTE|nr:mannitol-1-phosphate 5-dehydrogenase [Enterococcus sp. 669A]MBO1308677.1 mannitol-1-phosphate 5-dehydrogenase [Enterococcus sp. 669A]
MNSTLIIGAGKIGRGFIGQLMNLNGWHIYYAEYDQSLVDALNQENRYEVHILGNEERNSVVDNYEAFRLNEAKLNDAWKNSSLIFTAVGGKNLPSIARGLAEAFKANPEAGLKNIVTGENWKNPASDLRDAIYEHLSADDIRLFESQVGITEAVIMRIAVESSKEQKEQHPADVWVQDFWDLPIDRARFLGNPPKLEFVEFIDNFGSFLERKLYTNNTSNATIAYMGYQKGFEYTADAANDPSIERVLDKVYDEINEMVVRELGVDKSDQEDFAQKAKKKYSDKTIVDQLYRHAADPIRKLGPNDRLIAPAKMALKNGIQPTAMVQTIAAALQYDYEGDPIAQELQKTIQEKGIPYVLKNISKLNEEEELYQLIIEELKNQNIEV